MHAARAPARRRQFVCTHERGCTRVHMQPVPRAPSITQPLSPFRVATQPPLRVSGCPGEVLLPERPFLLPSSPQLRSAPSWACWRRSCSRAPRAWPRGRQTWTWLLWCPRKGAARAAQQGTAPALRAHRPDGAQAAVRVSPQLAAAVGSDVRRQCACGAAARARLALTSARGRSRQSAGARTASSLQQAWQARVPLCDAHALRRSRCTVKTTRRRFHLLPRRGERGGACACGLALVTTHSAPAVRCGLTRARFGRRSWPAGRCTQRPSARCTGKQARPRSERRCADCGVCFLHRDLTHSSPSFRPRLTVWRQGLLSAATRRFDGGCVRAELLLRRKRCHAKRSRAYASDVRSSAEQPEPSAAQAAMCLLDDDDTERAHILCSADTQGVCELSAYGLFPVRLELPACVLASGVAAHDRSPARAALTVVTHPVVQIRSGAWTCAACASPMAAPS